MTKTRATCALFSDGWSSMQGYCYGVHLYLDTDQRCKDCEHWLGSLRGEPVNKAPLLSPEELLTRRVSEMDGGDEG